VRLRSYRQDMERMQLKRIKDLIDELREMRQGTSPDLYRHYSGAISSLRHILRMHGIDYEPDWSRFPFPYTAFGFAHDRELQQPFTAPEHPICAAMKLTGRAPEFVSLAYRSAPHQGQAEAVGRFEVVADAPDQGCRVSCSTHWR
jgi:hypothetical protein